MTNTQNLNSAPTTNAPDVPNVEIPSFDSLWMEELKSLGFDFDNTGNVNYRGEPPVQSTQQGNAPQGEEGQQASTAPAPRPAYITSTLEAVINHEIQKVLQEDPYLNQGNIPAATREYLKNLPPEHISPETVRAALYMFFGNYAAKRLRYEQFAQEKSFKPTDVIPNPIKQKAQQYAEVWGIDPNELMDDFLKEVSNK